RLNLQGLASDTQLPFNITTDQPVKIDAEQAKQLRLGYAKWNKGTKERSISLYSRAIKDSIQPKQVTITESTKIEFLGARREGGAWNGSWWLHVRVDSQEGFVTGYQDFMTLGLPQAG